MSLLRLRVLVIDDSEGTLSRKLSHVLLQHEVESAHDAVEALHRIDCIAHRPFDVIYCELARTELTGPELWAYLTLTRRSAASRMVFIASEPMSHATRRFFDHVPIPCIDLPIESLAPRRVSSERHERRALHA